MFQTASTPDPTEPDYRQLFEATPAPYLVLRPDFTIVAVSTGPAVDSVALLQLLASAN